METLILIAFIIGYAFIALEEVVKVNKAATALLTGVLCWTIYILHTPDPTAVDHELIEHLGDVSQILFFLLGAMTIVELIDSHRGFEVITRKITTKDKRTLLWILSFITFFMSAVLDNLTTTIVMVTLARKLLEARHDRLLFSSMIVISANAGGAWTPIGDVTTTMLWIGGQISTLTIIQKILVPSLVSMLVPLGLLSFRMKGTFEPMVGEEKRSVVTSFETNFIFALGISALIFVPIFKTATHLPPFMGILIGLAVLWIASELIHKDKPEEEKITVTHALRKIDIPSILFFLGILVAVSALASTGLLAELAGYMDKHIGNLDVIAVSLGILSAVIDNVPLVAASMGMYDLATYPMDHYFWVFIAYCAGTGGSILIIGSAAGVAAMGIQRIEFGWYLKNISLIALLGYLAGAGVYMLVH